MGGFVCRDGGGEERMTLEEGGGGMSDSLTELGERLFILEGCSNVCFTRKGGKGGGGQVSSKQWWISVQSSQINIACLFPFPPGFPSFFFLAQAQGQ